MTALQSAIEVAMTDDRAGTFRILHLGLRLGLLTLFTSTQV